tara:strand:+ start:227 stop:760 length:534 start_codon:yes stop_codon:yes gene_type:complete
MKRSVRTVPFATYAIAALSLAGCGAENRGGDNTTDAGEEIAARGSYDIDAATGETRARHTDDDGTITTMRSGESVPVALPAGFAVYPGARVVNNTRVEQAEGLLVLLDLESAAPLEDMVSYYREQAEAAGVDVATSIQSGPMTMIGGEASDGTSFSFTATREDGITAAQLSIGRGLE